MTEPPPRLLVRRVSKRFPGVVALDAVDLDLQAGEIHGLMGENGAGKSTLIKILSGAQPPDEGEILLDGVAVHPGSPHDAETLGISTVFQEINLIPQLSLAENLRLGRGRARFGIIHRAADRRHAREVMSRLGIEVDVEAPLSSHPTAVRQMAAIARALDVQARVLILDEPTASLDAHEVERLFAALKTLRDQGLAIVFVTHFLDQVFAVADRITVLRNGTRVGTWRRDEIDRLTLVSRMLGREVAPAAASATTRAAASAAETLIEVRGLARRGAITQFDGTIRRGEVVGLAGLLGSGRTEVARLLFGADHADGGEIQVGGQSATLRSPRDGVALGFAFTPEDRQVDGIVPDLSVRENIVLALQASQGPWRRVPRRRQIELAASLIAALRIRLADPEQPVRTLSGGNQQKVLLARWMALAPRLFILDEPTRGIDVGAKEDVARLIDEFRQGGAAVILVCSEVEELLRSSDRIIVMRDRRSAGELAGDALDERSLMQLIAGADHD